jgi:O-antigen ligase
MLKKVINILLIMLLGAVFATAFMVSADLVDGTFTAKTFYFYLVCVAIFISLAVYLITNKTEIIFSLNKLDFVLLLFYGYSLIRLLFTEQVPLYNARIISFTFLIILYFIFKQIFFKRSKEKPNYAIYFLLFAYLTAGLLQGLIGLFQTYEIFGFSRANEFIAVGSFGNPAPYAGFIESVLPFAFGLTQLYEGNKLIDKLLKKYALLTFLVLVLVLPATETRGSWIASLVGIAFVLAIKYRLVEKLKYYLNKNWKKISAIVCSIALIILLFTALYHIRPASAFGRLLIWKVSANMLTDYPLFGIGYDSFGNNYNNYQAKYFAAEERSEFEKYVAGSVRQAHNEYIETTVELGFIGISLFVFLLYSALKLKNYAEADRNILINISKAALITLIIGACFSYPFQILPTFLNFIFLLSIISANGIPFKEFSLGFITNKTSTIKYAFVFIIIFILSVFVSKEFSNYKAHINWQKAIDLSYTQNYYLAIPVYESLYSDLKNQANFLQNYGGTLSLEGKHKEAIHILEECSKINQDPNLYISLGNSYEALGFFNKAKSSYYKSSYMIPTQFYPKYLLAKLFQSNGMYDHAKSIAISLITQTPKIPSTAIEQMKEEMKLLIKNPTLSGK